MLCPRSSFDKVLSTLRRLVVHVALVSVFLIGTRGSVSAFDTYWHFGMSDEVGLKYGFSADATSVLKLSSFCMDYFGPFITEVMGSVVKNVSYLELRNLPTTGETHAASNFMHFDNLASQLDRNWKFDYIWLRLLENTRKTIVLYYLDTALKLDERKRLILLALGASLHMVEDFYSHSDWVHFDFVKMGFKQRRTSNGDMFAPTWFEVRKRFGAPSVRGRIENWKFRLGSGIFPPADSVPLSSFRVPLSHTMMNHDNSQLFYDGDSRIKHHCYGACPATDSASASTHQLYAYSSACTAAIEWVQLLEESAPTRKAIEFAKRWDVSKADPDVLDDLKDGLSSAHMVSCIMQKWDGNHAPAERTSGCGILDLLPHIHIPTMGNIFWGSFPKDSILQHLTFGFSDSTGHYVFDSLWVGRHPMKRE